MLKRGQVLAALGNLVRLFLARRERDSRSRVLQYVGQPFRRFAEIYRHNHRAKSLNREIGHVPLRTVRRENSHAIAALDAKSSQRFGQARHAPEHFIRRNCLPARGRAIYLRARIRESVHRIQKQSRQRSVLSSHARHSSLAHTVAQCGPQQRRTGDHAAG